VTSPPREHTEHEDRPWTVEIPDHPERTDSPGFRRSKTTMHKILTAVATQPGAAILIRLSR